MTSLRMDIDGAPTDAGVDTGAPIPNRTRGADR